MAHRIPPGAGPYAFKGPLVARSVVSTRQAELEKVTKIVLRGLFNTIGIKSGLVPQEMIQALKGSQSLNRAVLDKVETLWWLNYHRLTAERRNTIIRRGLDAENSSICRFVTLITEMQGGHVNGILTEQLRPIYNMILWGTRLATIEALWDAVQQRTRASQPSVEQSAAQETAVAIPAGTVRPMDLQGNLNGMAVTNGAMRMRNTELGNGNLENGNIWHQPQQPISPLSPLSQFLALPLFANLTPATATTAARGDLISRPGTKSNIRPDKIGRRSSLTDVGSNLPTPPEPSPSQDFNQQTGSQPKSCDCHLLGSPNSEKLEEIRLEQTGVELELSPVPTTVGIFDEALALTECVRKNRHDTPTDLSPSHRLS